MIHVHNVGEAAILGGFLVVSGILVIIFAKPLVRGVGRQQQEMYGERGDRFAKRLRPWNYRAAGGIMCGIGIALLIFSLVATLS